MSTEQRTGWEIRPARVDDPAEVDRLYAVCLRTGANGQDASALFHDDRMLGDIFVGPYLALEPELAWVIAPRGGPAAGFVLGAADTEDFERTAESVWWPGVRERHGLVGRDQEDALPPGEAAARKAIRQPPRTPVAVTADYPAHLHIDLLPEAQGGGNGRRMIDTLLGALRARKVRGVHLGVGKGNTAAIGFYRHLGFEELSDEDTFLRMGIRFDVGAIDERGASLR
ncbi:GNAT family N-acetyltransferase [Microbacterium algeriense]|uniref:GNAT family N-acetyltransferase n=1 Tax=Microbacterium algeriense TaxID=2615184 RepID=UPI0022E48E43|nr:GNAT family N-acetyltransferase [Microbacterium algeriense]